MPAAPKLEQFSIFIVTQMEAGLCPKGSLQLPQPVKHEREREDFTEPWFFGTSLCMCRADSKRRSSHSQPERSGGMLQSLSRRSGNFSSEPQTASGSCLELEIIVVNLLCPAI